MALWSKAQQLPNGGFDHIQSIYNENFPVEVRHFLAPWIEAQNWDLLDPNFPAHENAIKELLLRFVREIENKANSLMGDDSFGNRMKLTDFANNFKQRCEANPADVYRTLKDNLATEMKYHNFYDNNFNPSQGLQMPNQQAMDIKNNVAKPPYYCNATYNEINRELDALQVQTTKGTELHRQLETEQEQLSIKYHEYQKVCSHLENAQRQASAYDQNAAFILNKLNQQKTALEQNLNQRIMCLREKQNNIVEKLRENVKHNEEMLKRLLDKELISWQRNQQYAGNGRECEVAHLDTLQNWMERLSACIWHSLTQSKEAIRLIKQYCTSTEAVESNSNLNSLQSLFETIVNQLRIITIRSFIIEKQPPQVMKTNTRFSAKVRFLVGSTLGLHMHLPQVKVLIISEAHANHLLTDKTLKGDGCGEILNNTGTMEVDPATKQLAITFRNMQLKKIKRAEKKGSESVVDEKFALYFCTSVAIGSDLNFPVWAFSLPVTVIVHGNQEPHAWATITWDNAFADPERKPFVVPDKVYWGKVATALNLKFTAVTGRQLSADNIKYLAEKLFKMKSDEYDTMQVSWAQFSKESLSERNFTFWDWFYAIMKLTREHLKPLWMDGLIMGFVRKKQAESLLTSSPLGTFLLRFSDSELGGITIAWHDVENDGAGNERSHVMMLQPFTSKDFTIRALADRINDLHQIRYLYPNIPKDKAFGRYYTPYNEPTVAANNGYVKPQLITHVPGRSAPQNDRCVIGPGGLSSYPTTPNSILHPSSPTDTMSLLNENTSSFVGDPYPQTNEMEYDDLMDFPAPYNF